VPGTPGKPPVDRARLGVRRLADPFSPAPDASSPPGSTCATSHSVQSGSKLPHSIIRLWSAAACRRFLTGAGRQLTSRIHHRRRPLLPKREQAPALQRTECRIFQPAASFSCNFPTSSCKLHGRFPRPAHLSSDSQFSNHYGSILCNQGPQFGTCHACESRFLKWKGIAARLRALRGRVFELTTGRWSGCPCGF
jgi:hypothetical protein